VLHAAHWKCRTQKSPKNGHLGAIAQLCRAIPSQLRHVSAIRKKNLLNSNISRTCPHNIVNFGPLTSKICSGVWAPQQISIQRVSRLGIVTARHSSSGRQPDFAALNRGCHLYSKGRSSPWAFLVLLGFQNGHCVFVSKLSNANIT